MTKLQHEGNPVGFQADGFYYDWNEYTAGNLIATHKRNNEGFYEPISVAKKSNIKDPIQKTPPPSSPNTSAEKRQDITPFYRTERSPDARRPTVVVDPPEGSGVDGEGL